MWIWLSPAEEAVFRRKAESFRSVSAMVRRAVELLDDGAVAQRFERIKVLTELYREFDFGLAMIGSNLNQTTRNMNQLMIGGQVTGPFIREVVYPAVRDTMELVAEIKGALRESVKSSTR